MVVDHVRRIGFKLFIKNENDNDRIIQTAAAVILIAVNFVQPFGINGTMAESYSLLLVFVCLMVFSALVSYDSL
tara:strand:- start:402 stop:623 length:222 start_codon:yes stop_codon:yes gene_type:complete